MPSTPAPARRPVSVTVNGRLYRGTYVVVGSTITVWALGQSETTQSGSMDSAVVTAPSARVRVIDPRAMRSPAAASI